MSQIVFRFFFFASVLVCLTAAGFAQTAQGVDTTFNAAPGKDVQSPSGGVRTQPDGKIIVFGNFQILNGAARNGIARLNADGTLDATFNCDACSFRVGSVFVQPDGKLLVGGTSENGFTLYFIRLNGDGTLDNTFTANVDGSFSQGIEVGAVQPDGKILVVISTVGPNLYFITLERLNPDGSVDTSFTALSFNGRQSEGVGQVAVLPDGKILVGGYRPSFGYLFRLNSDGSRDTTFDSPALTYNGTPPQLPFVSSFDFQTDGKIVFAGRFTSVNGVARNTVARLNTDGSVDAAFNPNQTNINLIRVLSNGKLLVSSQTFLRRLNADGSLDASFNQPANLLESGVFALDVAERILFFGRFLENGVEVYKFARLNADGSLDTSFNSAITDAAGAISALAIQPDGKIIASGDFLRMNGAARRRIARLNTDGSLDASFNAANNFDNAPNKIVVQLDGKILLVFAGLPSSLIRLNADGSVDSSFAPNVSPSSGVYAVAVQPDGKILIGGNFTAVNGAARTGAARLNADGSLDASFNPVLGSPSVSSFLVQTDGKILIGGTFSGANGFNRTNLARFNSDGSLDTGFNASISGVAKIESSPGGKYVVLSDKVRRLNADGSADAGFQVPNTSSTFDVRAILVQTDGAIVIGGSFFTINTVSRVSLARLKPNGTLDSTFVPSGANATVRALVRQADDKILVGGDFTSIGGVTRIGIARLISNPFHGINLFDFDGDGRADLTAFRPSNGTWYVSRNLSSTSFFGAQFGQAGDRLAPADYDGDGKTDYAVMRDSSDPNRSVFYLLQSFGGYRAVQFGASGDIPVPGDWDGDGKADLSVYRTASSTGGQNYFYYRPSSVAGADFRAVPWGTPGDKPIAADFDADGKVDFTVFRPSTGYWYTVFSANGQFRQVQFGQAGDLPVAADYDGDGKADIAVYRPSNGTWYRLNSSTGAFVAVQFGIAEDRPVAADYDGDGKADLGVWRPSNGNWYLFRSLSGYVAIQFGQNGDVPVEAAFVP